MKKMLLAIVAAVLMTMMVSKAEAGRWGYGYGGPAVSYGWVRPMGPVVVAPRYYRPAYVARPYYARPYYYGPTRYGYAPWRTGVMVQGGYGGGGGVIVRTPGFGLDVRY